MTQSKINFKGAAANPPIAKTNNTEEQDNTIVNDPKRQRTDDEDIEDGELREELLLIPPVSGSEMSLFNADSITTIIDAPPRESLPAHRTNNEHFLTTDEIDVKVIKLERLRDKSDRYSSHIEFLKEFRDK